MHMSESCRSVHSIAEVPKAPSTFCKQEPKLEPCTEDENGCTAVSMDPKFTTVSKVKSSTDIRSYTTLCIDKS